jgi:hypothetical protein
VAEVRRGDPPPAPRVPARKALFLFALGMCVCLAGVGLAVAAFLAPGGAALYGRTAAMLAGGGVFVASMGAPALKRQSMARDALAAFAAKRGFSLASADVARGEVDGVKVAVRILYGSGPYKARGASAILVHVRPGAKDATHTIDSEMFDDEQAVVRHMDRLCDRALRPPSTA